LKIHIVSLSVYIVD